MSKRIKPGDRVGAILSMAAGGPTHFLGYGVYVGDEVPTDEGGGSLTGLLAEQGVPNPKIVLDNGDVVWGCECWWGSESEIQARINGNTNVKTVRISDERQACAEKKPSPMGDFFGSGSGQNGSGGFWN